MCMLDRKETSRYSQSVNKYILGVQDIYKNSPVPVCVRNQRRKIIYANGAFIELFSKEDKPLSGESYIRFQVEVFLSSLEIECQALGHGAAFCRCFNFHGEIYQIRMENISFDNDEYVVLWQINPFPDYPFFALTQKKTTPFVKDNSLWSELSPGTLVVFSFYMFGVSHPVIAKELGITSRASEDRIKPVKRRIKKKYKHFDLFRLSCIAKGEIHLPLSIIREFYSVK
ncbi:PAS domain-containing protein [Salmonella enterica subsp. enterica serovar Enteritidis]|uniref:PAS domain-containing protein n=1 Tax=Salmonella enteritidis TaxID=149539 RepID=A0A5V0BEP7_SALEN|nr:PAS domain-containing protein [Salmonella enterica subsp. enterica serovar Enteritidis]ECA1251897.1 PAS domain-containing protein [Salmonella enterica subsp. enterica serovar Chailey]ECA1855962.1 PAS domain-containing protein [Salmonella enterica subsp. enterica serovar Chailey]